MICPSLSELPSPPPGKIGWPWTEETSWGLLAFDNPAAAPRISIITPSFNQGQFLEETIRSILLQRYPDVEYIIIDGGSTDESCEIINKYKRWISYAVSEPDHGQAHALNKGIANITGRVFGWINSDDLLLPGALNLIGCKHANSPGCIIAGDVLIFQDGLSEADEEYCRQSGIQFRNFVEFWRPERDWAQPGVFLPTELMRKIGDLDETLHYAFDHDLMCRTLPLAKVELLHKAIARYRHHSASKTVSQNEFFHLETVRVTRKYWSSLPEMNRSAATRHCVSLLMRTGLNRAMAGKSASAFLTSAIRVHALWAFYSAAGWAARRWLRFKHSKLASKIPEHNNAEIR
jgi:glycosyltransferase involved in cell wall biosynthesis